MGRKYAKPPIIEAVCEFRLTPESKWDLTIPGLVYEQVKALFRNKEQRLIQEIELSHSREGLEQQVRTNERICFLTEDRKRFIQLGTRLLAVNCLKPYPTWKEFKPIIETAFHALTIAGEITELRRIGLRYINLIEVPGTSVKLEKYFQFRPHLGDKLPQDTTNFIVGCLLPLSGGRDSCKIQLVNAATGKKDTSAFLLDIDHFTAQPEGVSRDAALTWVEEAHHQLEKNFEACITDELREFFEEIK